MSAETENSKFFQHSREITFKFELNVYNHWGDNEQKLNISDIFSKVQEG
jgi:hypothetical protein